MTRDVLQAIEGIAAVLLGRGAKLARQRLAPHSAFEVTAIITCAEEVFSP